MNIEELVAYFDDKDELSYLLTSILLFPGILSRMDDETVDMLCDHGAVGPDLKLTSAATEWLSRHPVPADALLAKAAKLRPMKRAA